MLWNKESAMAVFLLFATISVTFHCVEPSTKLNKAEMEGLHFKEQLSATELNEMLKTLTLQLNALTTRKCQLCFRVRFLFFHFVLSFFSIFLSIFSVFPFQG